MTATGNPFYVVGHELCDDMLPQVPTCQHGTHYSQLRSQVQGLILLPIGGERPTDWQIQSGWDGVINNGDTSGQKGKYIAVSGSFVEAQATEVSLSGGRAVETRARLYRLAVSTPNLNAGHINIARLFQKNVRFFDVWFETVGGRLIGGEKGLRPFFVNAVIPFGGGNDDRERIEYTLEFHLNRFPDSVLTDFSLESNEGSLFWQQEDLENWMGEATETDWQGE